MDKKCWPLTIPSGSNYTSMEKALFSSFEKNIADGWLVLDADPVGLKSDKVKMGFLIKGTGLITFSIHETINVEEFRPIVKMYTEMVENKIRELLEESALLIGRIGGKKFLKFPYCHINILNNDASIHDELSEYVAGNIFAKKETVEKILTIAVEKYKFLENPEISEKMAISILSKLAPEYTVIKPAIQKVENNYDDINTEINLESLPDITGKEIEYSTFLLDDDQVKYINEMGTGHRVLLANAGAGKSVLLLSRAYRYASAHKNERVLITCYNNNLADAYKFKNSCSNFGDNKNVYIMTFHKLVEKIYGECLHINLGNNYASEQDIRDLFTYINKGKVDLKFAAIFIDEVQIFDPLYLDICYSLLSENKDALFLLAGDLNQTVRKQSRRGEVPWKKINNGRLNFTGRVKYMSKNYRNSYQISVYLNKMLIYMNKRLSEAGLINDKEFDYNVFGNGKSKDVALLVNTGIQKSEICKRVMDAIDEITQKYKIAYSDIAILFPYSKNKKLNYYISYWITTKLKERGVEYSFISGAGDDGPRKQYSRTNGIVLSTIDSALGLDFKAVILTGLYPYGYIYSDEGNGRPIKISSWKQLSNLKPDEKETAKTQLRKLYTACSRAREVLYVLSDITKGSPFEDISEDRSNEEL